MLNLQPGCAAWATVAHVVTKVLDPPPHFSALRRATCHVRRTNPVQRHTVRPFPRLCVRSALAQVPAGLGPRMASPAQGDLCGDWPGELQLGALSPWQLQDYAFDPATMVRTSRRRRGERPAESQGAPVS